MYPHIDFITLAVADLQRSLEFYRDGLGLQTKGIFGKEFHDERSGAGGAVVFFEMQGGLTLALYERDNLAKDGAISPGAPSSVEFSLGHVVKTKDEVDAIVERAKQAGAVVTDPPRERPWGIYSGYFKDLDGHLWEITWSIES